MKEITYPLSPLGLILLNSITMSRGTQRFIILLPSLLRFQNFLANKVRLRTISMDSSFCNKKKTSWFDQSHKFPLWQFSNFHSVSHSSNLRPPVGFMKTLADLIS